MLDHSATSRFHTAEMLEEILAAGHMVMLSRDEDGLYHARRSGKPPRVAESLEACIEALTDHPRMKICLRQDCDRKGQPMPLDCFGPDRDSRDGKAGVCKGCEAKRIGRLDREKKGPVAEGS